MYYILCTADDNAHTLSHQNTVFMMSLPLQAGQHSPCIRHHTHLLCDIIWTIYNITANIMSHYCAYYNTASIYERISSLRQHIHLICDITATIWVITCTVQAVSHPLCLWQHTRHMCGIVCIIQDIASSLFDRKPPSWGHHTHFIRYCVHCICHHTYSIDDITGTTCMASHPVYL